MMTTHEWQLYVSNLTYDQWMKILLSHTDYEYWISIGCPKYAQWIELKNQKPKL